MSGILGQMWFHTLLEEGSSILENNGSLPPSATATEQGPSVSASTASLCAPLISRQLKDFPKPSARPPSSSASSRPESSEEKERTWIDQLGLWDIEGSRGSVSTQGPESRRFMRDEHLYTNLKYMYNNLTDRFRNFMFLIITAGIFYSLSSTWSEALKSTLYRQGLGMWTRVITITVMAVIFLLILNLIPTSAVSANQRKF